MAPRPGETVLDLAAAPGGKAIHLAGLMGNRGRLSVVEPVKARFFRLRANLERCGVEIARLYRTDGRTVGRKCPGMFDRVLLDAPCASEARFRAGAEATYAHWSPRKVRECAHKQRGLLRAALESVRVGGRVVYCTCSLSLEENEGVVAAALEDWGEALEVESLGGWAEHLPPEAVLPGLEGHARGRLDPRVARTLRLLPDARFDALFVASLRRRA